MAQITLSKRIRKDRKIQTLTGKVEYVSGTKGNITQEGFEGPYAVLSLEGSTKVRIIGSDSVILNEDDIVSVQVGNPTSEARGMWNTTIEAAPTILKLAENQEGVEKARQENTVVQTEVQDPQKGLSDNALKEAALLRWKRPISDDKLSSRLGVTNDQVLELTANPEYVTCVEEVLLSSIDTQSGKIKMKNYIRMATQYRKVCVRQALARKMRISIDDANSVFGLIESKLA